MSNWEDAGSGAERPRLTEAAIREAVAGDRRVELVEDGLQLRVNKDGSKTWSLRYRRPDGRRRRLRLGVYAEESSYRGAFDAETFEPGDGPLTLEEARAVARAQRARVLTADSEPTSEVSGKAPSHVVPGHEASRHIDEGPSDEEKPRRVPLLLTAALAAVLVLAVSAVLWVGRGDSRGTETGAEFPQQVIEGEMAIEADDVLNMGSVSVADGSHVTLKARDLVALGEGFEVGDDTDLTIVLSEKQSEESSEQQSAQ